MNDFLKIHVERAVRPLRAAHETRMRMREEMHALLSDIHEQELSRHADAAAAAAAAIERFGDPRQLAQELQQSVPRQDAFVELIERGIRKRVNESTARHAARMALVMFVFSLAVGSVAFAARGLLNDVPAPRVALVFSCVLVGLMALNTFIFILLNQFLTRCFSQAHRTAARAGLVGIPLLAGALGMATIVVPTIVVAGEIQPALDTLASTLPAGLSVMVLMPTATWLVLREQRQAEPWEALVLD